MSNLLKGTRVYLSGPMDFVGSREDEKRFGWRNRMSKWLQKRGAVVFDPWNKPTVRWLEGYGLEDEHSVQPREHWTFESSREGAKTRATCAQHFWPIMHIDLRMVDVSDFVIAYCPTNVYSVGTPHEIVIARQQHKPVLMVCPPVEYQSLLELETAIADNPEAEAALERFKQEAHIKENPQGLPSSWYMPLLNGEHFFDGFGFGLEDFRDEFEWEENKNFQEGNRTLQKPLLPILEGLSHGERPRRWDRKTEQFIDDDNWIVLNLED